MSSCSQGNKRRKIEDLRAIGLGDSGDSHALTVQLCEEARSFKPCDDLLQHAVLSMQVSTNGHVTLLMAPLEGYGYSNHTWRIEIGGPGPGVDFEFCDVSNSSFHMEDRAPVAIRFCTPISHYHCDDSGQVDMEFWKSFDGFSKSAENSTEVNLENICRRLLLLLKEPLNSEHGKCTTDDVRILNFS